MQKRFKTNKPGNTFRNNNLQREEMNHRQIIFKLKLYPNINDTIYNCKHLFVLSHCELKQ